MSDIFKDICQMLHGIENYHDSCTEKHELRTGKLMSLLANALGLEKSICTDLNEVGAVHDIGKIALPKSILEKPGTLTMFERKVVELHPSIGFEIIKKIHHPQCELACVVILTHHENFDGSGYPKGLKGNKIPLEGRICAICDVYDALREKRIYREGRTHIEAFNMIFDSHPKGLYHKFDPNILDTFKSLSADIQKLYD